MRISRATLIAILLSGVGCTQFQPHPGFDDVERIANERVAAQVVWNNGTDVDAVTRGHVQRLLSEELTMNDVVQITLLNNLGLQATYQELGIAQADLIQAGLVTNPSLGFERRFPGRAAEADVALNFLDVFLVPLRHRVAGAGFDGAKLRVALEVIDQAFDARRAYLNLQGELQMLAIRRDLAAVAEATAEAARRLHEAGNISILEVQAEDLSVAEHKLELAEAGGAVAQSRESLNRLMGLWGGDTNWSISGRLPELPIDDALPESIEAVAVRNRLDLAAALRELEAAAERVGIARINAIVPDLTLTGHYEREPEGETTSGPSLALPLPIFNWGRAASAGARARLVQAHQQYAALAVGIRSEVRAAFARMALARARAAYYKGRVLPLQAQALEQTQLRYNGMFVGVFELLRTKRGQIDAEKNYAAALLDYWSARTELERAVGRSLPLPVSMPALATESSGAAAEVSQSEHEGHLH